MLPKKCILTVEPLSRDILLSFDPIPLQAWAMPKTIEMFEDGFPPHQAALLCDGKAVLIMGLIEQEPGVFWTWCIFGNGFRLLHYREFIKFFKNYLKLLEWKQILHIIDKQKPWTRHMARSLGFFHSHDADDQYEWWVING